MSNPSWKEERNQRSQPDDGKKTSENKISETPSAEEPW